VTNGKVGCALVGFGYWGPNLARNVQSHADAELLYVCDLDPAELDRVRELHPGVATTHSYDEILGDPAVDAVLIATPPASHAALGLAAIAAGKHLFVEKPLATSLSDALELAGAAYRSALTLMVGHTFLYSPAIRKIRQLIDLGEVGEIVHISSSRLSLGLFQQDLNVVWDLMPHDFSIIQNLVDPGHPERVVAAGSSHMVPGVEDTVNAYLEYDSGLTVEVRASWIYPLKVRDLTIIGTRKMIVFDDTQPIDKIRVVDRRLEVAQPSTSLGEFHMSYRYGDTFMPLLENTEPLATEIADFVHCVQTGDTPVSDAGTGVRVVEALEKVQSSLRQTGAPTVAEFSPAR
jgi:predicted dehydrogenase